MWIPLSANCLSQAASEEIGHCDELITLAKSSFADLSPAARLVFLAAWAVCQLHTGSTDQAMSLWEAAIRLQPNYLVAYTKQTLVTELGVN